MFFPYNVDSQIKSSKKVDSGTKATVSFLVFGIGVVVLYSVLRNLTYSIGLPVFIPLLITLVIAVLAGILILRFFVFNEKFMLESEEDSRNDSLGKYYKIRESELPRIIEGVEVFENTDGILCACLEILYGANDKTKSEYTLSYLINTFKLISEFSTDFKAFVTMENFIRSKECKNFMNTVNQDSNPKLKPLISEMCDLILSYTEENSYLYSTFIIIRFPAINGYLLKGLKTKFNEMVSNSTSSIRSMEFVDRARFRDFIRNYNLVESLDLSSYKVSNLPSNIYRKYKKSIFLIEGVDTKYGFDNGVMEK